MCASTVRVHVFPGGKVMIALNKYVRAIVITVENVLMDIANVSLVSKERIVVSKHAAMIVPGMGHVITEPVIAMLGGLEKHVI